MPLSTISTSVWISVVLFFSVFHYLLLISGPLPLPQLDQMCLGKSPTLEDVKVESQRQNIQALLDLLKQSCSGGQTDSSPSTLSALHLIISALDGE